MRSADPIGIFSGKPSLSGAFQNALDPLRLFTSDPMKSTAAAAPAAAAATPVNPNLASFAAANNDADAAQRKKLATQAAVGSIFNDSNTGKSNGIG